MLSNNFLQLQKSVFILANIPWTTSDLFSTTVCQDIFQYSLLLISINHISNRLNMYFCIIYTKPMSLSCRCYAWSMCIVTRLIEHQGTSVPLFEIHIITITNFTSSYSFDASQNKKSEYGLLFLVRELK